MNVFGIRRCMHPGHVYSIKWSDSIRLQTLLAFPEDEFYQFQRDVLAPLADPDPDDVEKMARLMVLQKSLFGATVAIAQLYLDGEMSREEAIANLQKYGLMNKEGAEGQIQFIEGYRAYLVNFTVGEELVAASIQSNARTEEDRWALYKSLSGQNRPASHT